jgi:hypothetical protein
MKPTPRMAERVVAQQITELSAQLGASPVMRIPVLGKVGPDLEINQLGLVIDVKSRKSIPATWLAGPGELIFGGDLVGFRISDVGNLETLRRRATKSSKTVRMWLDHMDEWRQEHCPDGISAMVVRRPGMGRQASTVIIFEREQQQWNQRTTQSYR